MKKLVVEKFPSEKSNWTYDAVIYCFIDGENNRCLLVLKLCEPISVGVYVKRLRVLVKPDRVVETINNGDHSEYGICRMSRADILAATPLGNSNIVVYKG